jgi:hypothetical protein
MTDDDEAVPDQGPRDADSYLYDFFKYLTSVSLLTIGGILTVSQLPEAADLKRSSLLITMTPVALSTLMAFSGAGELVKAKSNDKPLSGNVRRLGQIAPIAFLIGIGSFIFMFLDVMY